MKLLTATRETQGQRKNDFSFCNEGEVVKFNFECDGGSIDDSCGCKRSMSGAVSHKSTTTMKVIDSALTRSDLREILLKTLKDEGWIKEGQESTIRDNIDRDVDELLRTANAFKVGDIVEKRGSKLNKRIPTRVV